MIILIAVRPILKCVRLVNHHWILEIYAELSISKKLTRGLKMLPLSVFL